MDKKICRITGSIASLLLLLFILTGCVSGTDSPASDILLINSIPIYVDGSLTDYIESGDAYSIKEYNPTQYELYDESGKTIPPLTDNYNVPNINLYLSLDIGTTSKDLYFIFTNISPYADTDYPALNDQDLSIQQAAVTSSTATKPKPVLPDMAGTRGKPEVTEFNRNPYASLNKINPVTLLLNLVPAPEPVADEAGSSQSYFKIDRYTSVAATCRYVSPSSVTTASGEKTLNIWVADNCWTGIGSKRKLVNQTMVNGMAEKFLKDSLDNDIYDWVTAIYGEEWGDEFKNNNNLSPDDKEMLIGKDISKNEITILLFDIDNDNSTSGGVLGYFWAKDNFKTSAISYSNERIMLYLDAVLYATDEGAIWNVTDRWPSEIISTLAHEFQHMIQFYQKTVLLTDGSSGTETWIDEMCSLATEDLVANKLDVNGPRGADYSSATCTADAGDEASPYISLGRLPIFNYFDEYSVTAWYSGSNKLISYSLNYALGSYLARNYGGAEFFRNVVRNEYTDYRAIEYALNQVSPALPIENCKIGSVLRKWAATNLVSDKYDRLEYYYYNNGLGEDWFYSYSYTPTLEYTLGSIDLYQYRYEYSAGRYYYGPYIYKEMRTGNMPAASNIYYLAEKSLSGSQTWNIRLKSNVRLTVVARDTLPAHP